MQHIEYVKNVFVKYLEYLASNKTKEIKTIENILFTELKVSKDEALRLDHLRKSNTFWKKFLSFSGPTQDIKSKFSAGELKKRLFGKSSTIGQYPPQNSSRPSIIGADAINQSLGDNNMLNTTGGVINGEDFFY